MMPTSSTPRCSRRAHADRTRSGGSGGGSGAGMSAVVQRRHGGGVDEHGARRSRPTSARPRLGWPCAPEQHGTTGTPRRRNRGANADGHDSLDIDSRNVRSGGASSAVASALAGPKAVSGSTFGADRRVATVRGSGRGVTVITRPRRAGAATAATTVGLSPSLGVGGGGRPATAPAARATGVNNSTSMSTASSTGTDHGAGTGRRQPKAPADSHRRARRPLRGRPASTTAASVTGQPAHQVPHQDGGNRRPTPWGTSHLAPAHSPTQAGKPRHTGAWAVGDSGVPVLTEWSAAVDNQAASHTSAARFTDSSHRSRPQTVPAAGNHDVDCSGRKLLVGAAAATATTTIVAAMQTPTATATATLQGLEPQPLSVADEGRRAARRIRARRAEIASHRASQSDSAEESERERQVSRGRVSASDHAARDSGDDSGRLWPLADSDSDVHPTRTAAPHTPAPAGSEATTDVASSRLPAQSHTAAAESVTGATRTVADSDATCTFTAPAVPRALLDVSRAAAATVARDAGAAGLRRRRGSPAQLMAEIHRDPGTGDAYSWLPAPTQYLYLQSDPAHPGAHERKSGASSRLQLGRPAPPSTLPPAWRVFPSAHTFGRRKRQLSPDHNASPGPNLNPSKSFLTGTAASGPGVANAASRARLNVTAKPRTGPGMARLKAGFPGERRARADHWHPQGSQTQATAAAPSTSTVTVLADATTVNLRDASGTAKVSTARTEDSRASTGVWGRFDLADTAGAAAVLRHGEGRGDDQENIQDSEARGDRGREAADSFAASVTVSGQLAHSLSPSESGSRSSGPVFPSSSLRGAAMSSRQEAEALARVAAALMTAAQQQSRSLEFESAGAAAARSEPPHRKPQKSAAWGSTAQSNGAGAVSRQSRDSDRLRGSPGAREYVRRTQLATAVHRVVAKELCRQVFTHCEPRGILLEATLTGLLHSLKEGHSALLRQHTATEDAETRFQRLRAESHAALNEQRTAAAQREAALRREADVLRHLWAAQKDLRRADAHEWRRQEDKARARLRSHTLSGDEAMTPTAASRKALIDVASGHGRRDRDSDDWGDLPLQVDAAGYTDGRGGTHAGDTGNDNAGDGHSTLRLAGLSGTRASDMRARNVAVRDAGTQLSFPPLLLVSRPVPLPLHHSPGLEPDFGAPGAASERARAQPGLGIGGGTDTGTAGHSHGGGGVPVARLSRVRPRASATVTSTASSSASSSASPPASPDTGALPVPVGREDADASGAATVSAFEFIDDWASLRRDRFAHVVAVAVTATGAQAAAPIRLHRGGATAVAGADPQKSESVGPQLHTQPRDSGSQSGKRRTRARASDIASGSGSGNGNGNGGAVNAPGNVRGSRPTPSPTSGSLSTQYVAAPLTVGYAAPRTLAERSTTKAARAAAAHYLVPANPGAKGRDGGPGSRRHRQSTARVQVTVDSDAGAVASDRFKLATGDVPNGVKTEAEAEAEAEADLARLRAEARMQQLSFTLAAPESEAAATGIGTGTSVRPLGLADGSGFSHHGANSAAVGGTGTGAPAGTASHGGASSGWHAPGPVGPDSPSDSGSWGDPGALGYPWQVPAYPHSGGRFPSQVGADANIHRHGHGDSDGGTSDGPGRAAPVRVNPSHGGSESVVPGPVVPRRPQPPPGARLVRAISPARPQTAGTGTRATDTARF